MSRIEELNKHVFTAVERISLLGESDTNEVRKIYQTVIEKYFKLMKDDFETIFLYEQYLKIRAIKMPLFRMEIGQLLSHNNSFMSNNFFQIKVSISSLEI